MLLLEALLIVFQNIKPKGSNYFRIGGAVFSDYQPSARIRPLHYPINLRFGKMVDSYEAITPYGDTFTQKQWMMRNGPRKGNADRQNYYSS